MRLEPEDFEVAETERRASAAVALCVDLSFSMFADGRWGPMKQTALALSHLVATQFPQDSLQIIGFGRYAMTLSQGELAAIEPDLVQGTNLQHALKLAGRHLRRHPGSEPVVLVVTDGEPTAHLDDDGEAFFYVAAAAGDGRAPRSREVDQLTRYGATLNLFMLGEDPGAAPVRRRGGPAQRRAGVQPGRRGAGPVRGRRLRPRPPRPALRTGRQSLSLVLGRRTGVAG